jgi:hypothetical protein
MAAGLQGGTALVFSIEKGDGANDSFGIVQSVSINETVERAEAKGPDGHTYSVQEYDDKKELSLTYLEKSSLSGEAAIGSTFTYDSITWYVNSINSTDTVDGFRSVEVTATNYPNLGA